jgi:hypothetical protein
VEVVVKALHSGARERYEKLVGEGQMDKIVRGMVQVGGTTYRIIRLSRGQGDVVRVLDDALVGGFSRSPRVEIRPQVIEPALMREIARVAIQGAKTSWVGRSLLA